jgi:hypothetical protein
VRLPAVLVIVLALASGSALAANPTPGARYEGRTAQKLAVSAKAASSGARLSTFRFAWRAPVCRSARNGTRGTSTLRSIRVRGGRFSKTATRRVTLPAAGGFGGGTQVETVNVRGRLPLRSRIVGSVFVRVRVLSKAGIEVDSCAMRKRVKFTARRLGVTEQPYQLP